MKKTVTFLPFYKWGILCIFCTPIFIFARPNTNTIAISYHSANAPDSIGTEIINGEVYILHQVERKDTYYALSRRYNSPVNSIMAANNKKTLKPGDTVKVPTGRRSAQEQAVPTLPKTTNTSPQERILTEYKVGKNETLYAISRRFNTTVEDIKKMNNLTSDTLKDGQLLKIPNSDYIEPAPIIETPVIAETPIIEEPRDLGIESNRYGIREKKEKGIGVWMDNLETTGKSNLALHRTAPIGTILKVTNPMTNNVTYAKVVGKFTDNAETHDAIVILSKSAASYIGALDRRFLIEIAYGVPLQ